MGLVVRPKNGNYSAKTDNCLELKAVSDFLGESVRMWKNIFHLYSQRTGLPKS